MASGNCRDGSRRSNEADLARVGRGIARGTGAPALAGTTRSAFLVAAGFGSSRTRRPRQRSCPAYGRLKLLLHSGKSEISFPGIAMANAGQLWNDGSVTL